jgi:quinol monooxygenase YgiN
MPVADPIIYVDRSSIAAGKLEQLKVAIEELAEFVQANEPQLPSYAAFIDESAMEMTVVHVHRDQESLDRHMRIAGPRFAAFADLVNLRSIDVYGRPSDDAVAQMQAKGRMLGGAPVTVHSLHAGFIRDG